MADRLSRTRRDLVDCAIESLALPRGLSPSRYEVEREIGRGGMGIVCRAWDRDLQRPVALKLMGEAIACDAPSLERFRREVQITSRLSHPGIVRVFDAGESRGRPYLVMELVEGRPWSELLPGERRDPRPAIRILEDVARAVHHAHEQGVVHRDLKPGNVLIDGTGRPRIVDFGLGYLLDPEPDAGPRLTRTGAILGTPAYMAPEQMKVTDDPISPRTDVFALGAILYEILTGRPPFLGSLAAICRQAAVDEALPARWVDRRIPRPLEAIASKALRRAPAERYSSALALAEDLSRWLDGRPVEARPAGLLERVRRFASRHRAATAGVLSTAVLGAISGGFVLELRKRDSDLAEENSRAASHAQEVDRLRQAERIRTASTTEVEAARHALEEAQRALYQHGTDPEVLQHAVRMAEARLETVLERDPEFAKAHHQVGLLRSFLGDEAAAEASLREAIRLDPEMFRARLDLGWLLLHQSVLATFEDRAGLRSTVPGGDRSAEAMAEIATAARPMRDAETWWGGDLLALAIVRAMYTYVDEGGSEAFFAFVDETLAPHPGTAGTELLHFLRGVARGGAEGAESLRTALRICPGHWPAHLALAEHHFEAGRYDEAALEFEELVRWRPRHPMGWSGRAVCTFLAGRRAEGLAAIDAAIAEFPDVASFHVDRAFLRSSSGDLEGAERDALEAIRLDPELPEGYLNLAVYRRRRGDLDGSLAAVQEAIRRAPTFRQALLNLGNLLDARGDPSGAADAYGRAIEAAPDDPEPRLLRGLVRARTGEAAGAVEDLEAALVLAPAGWEHRAEAELALQALRSRK